ncbi:MAG: hypothetical protein QG565_645 [Campylobacterota bacterium]|nr:hypothetical protein [Campylobacterota bacterium]MDQ1268151.1 hypothetical protein [Campylobacterota bacterium]MDQ1337831.1 hypothetical protein [Campylobacterota bacterium]
MFTKYSKKIETLFLEPSLEFKSVEQNVNIILSPSFYWVKKISLPLKRERDVKKLLPSIFEEILPNGNYSYTVYKKEDYFLAFAYEDRVILEFLAARGVSMPHIANICFAQIFFSEADLPLRISKERTLVMQDGIVLMVPSSWQMSAKEFCLDDRVFPKQTIVLEKFNHIVDKKNIYQIGSLLVFVALLFGTELFMLQQNRDDVLSAKENLFATHNLKSTMMQNESMAKRYSALHEEQMKFRGIIAAIINLQLGQNEKIDSISYQNRSIRVLLNGVKESDFKHIAEALRAKNIGYKVNFKDTMAILEVQL